MGYERGGRLCAAPPPPIMQLPPCPSAFWLRMQPNVTKTQLRFTLQAQSQSPSHLQGKGSSLCWGWQQYVGIQLPAALAGQSEGSPSLANCNKSNTAAQKRSPHAVCYSGTRLERTHSAYTQQAVYDDDIVMSSILTSRRATSEKHILKFNI